MLALKEWLPGLGKKKVAFNETFSSNKILNKTPKDGRGKRGISTLQNVLVFYIKLPEQDILALF